LLRGWLERTSGGNTSILASSSVKLLGRSAVVEFDLPLSTLDSQPLFISRKKARLVSVLFRFRNFQRTRRGMERKRKIPPPAIPIIAALLRPLEVSVAFRLLVLPFGKSEVEVFDRMDTIVSLDVGVALMILVLPFSEWETVVFDWLAMLFPLEGDESDELEDGEGFSVTVRVITDIWGVCVQLPSGGAIPEITVISLGKGMWNFAESLKRAENNQGIWGGYMAECTTMVPSRAIIFGTRATGRSAGT
jgi:hypothetical protein